MRKLRNLSDVKLPTQGRKARMWQREQLNLALWDGRAALFGTVCLSFLVVGGCCCGLQRKRGGVESAHTGFVMVTRKVNIVQHLLFAKHCAKHFTLMSSCASSK